VSTLDADVHDDHCLPGADLETRARHMQHWHGQRPDATGSTRLDGPGSHSPPLAGKALTGAPAGANRSRRRRSYVSAVSILSRGDVKMRSAYRCAVLLGVAAIGGCGSSAPTAPTCGFGAFGGSCGGSSTPTIPVVTRTLGANPDANGYQVRISRQSCTRSTAIGVNETRWFESCGQGANTVELADVAANCTVAGPNPRHVDVGEIMSAEVRFEVSCP
jgi:hypothetical protein